MKRFLYTILLLGFLVLLCISCNLRKSRTEVSATETEEIKANLDAYFSALTAIDKFNGVVLVKREGSTVVSKAYNMIEQGNSSMRVSANSQFDIHSISKLMAKACIVKLEMNGTLSASDRIIKYIPDFPKGNEISIQHLLDNQSGLPRELSKKHPELIEKSPEEIVALIKQEALLFDPGSDTLYSNLGYQLLYYIISEITKKPFVAYLNDEFFVPLEMESSGAHFYLDKQNLTHPVTNHQLEDGEITAIPNFSGSSKNQAKVFSSTNDLWKFLELVRNEPYASRLKGHNGNIAWSGGGEGILSHAEINLSANYDLVFFSNYDEIPFGKILKDVERIMTNQNFELPKEINRQVVRLDRNIMEGYAGKYDMAEFNHDEFEIRIEENKFAFYQNGEFGGLLQAQNDSILFNKPDDEDYFLFRKAEGEGYKLIFVYKGIEIEGKRK